MPEREGRAYPVVIDVEPQPAGRNRLTVAFRLILAIPHVILVGAPGFALGIHNETVAAEGGPHSTSVGGNGLLGVVAFVGAVFSWFAIVFTGRHPRATGETGQGDAPPARRRR